MADRTIYVAGASLEAQECAEAIGRLGGAGWIVTLDWTPAVLALPSHDAIVSPDVALDHAVADGNAVLAADWFWIRAPESASTGAWVELGIAWASKPTTRIVYSGPKRGIFWTLAGHVFDRHDEALAFLIDR